MKHGVKRTTHGADSLRIAKQGRKGRKKGGRNRDLEKKEQWGGRGGGDQRCHPKGPSLRLEPGSRPSWGKKRVRKLQKREKKWEKRGGGKRIHVPETKKSRESVVGGIRARPG